jgi:hypothetical protein
VNGCKIAGIFILHGGDNKLRLNFVGEISQRSVHGLVHRRLGRGWDTFTLQMEIPLNFQKEAFLIIHITAMQKSQRHITVN